MNTYRVWIIGRKETTESKIEAETKLNAQIAFGARMGEKSYNVEAIKI